MAHNISDPGSKCTPVSEGRVIHYNDSDDDDASDVDGDDFGVMMIMMMMVMMMTMALMMMIIKCQRDLSSITMQL